ncbi:MAG: FtsX-like permease family protein [Gemmatimonadetes bacterium]|nr:FtsX-like permease family protein [Gemmatimonadota bacterium]MXY82166.1 FtsX-like permease family protein [Gemmatimonadota bacterium]MYB67482.1 FtsX-like permease family protein [Gemmatimonadota bacterium]
MIRHLCKLVWNRKRANALIALQIFISFLLVFTTASLAMDKAGNYWRPLGFSYEDRWVVTFHPDRVSGRVGGEKPPASRREIYLALEGFDWIESVSSADYLALPYKLGLQVPFTVDGRLVSIGSVSDQFHQTLGLDLVSGRWFGEEDAALDWEPIVITQPLSEALFDDEDPIGQKIEEWEGSNERIIGVVSDYRRLGEFTDPGFFVFTRQSAEENRGNFLVKVRPGTPLAAQEQIDKRLKAMAPGYEVKITTLADSRASLFKLTLVPLFALGVVSVLVLGMVALSLSGVLWQRTTLRTEEIGLRRALGGSAASIYAQLTGEIVAVASVGVIAGLLLVLQFPLLELLNYTSGIYALSLAFAALVIYGLVIVCSLYPGRLACQVRPVEALHHE